MDLAEVEKFEQKVGTIKLSAAIRIGAKLRPRCKRYYFSDGGSCALGAAWEGAGQQGEPYGYEELGALFHLSEARLKGIAGMNDRGWTREAIADWLEAQGL